MWTLIRLDLNGVVSGWGLADGRRGWELARSGSSPLKKNGGKGNFAVLA